MLTKFSSRPGHSRAIGYAALFIALVVPAAAQAGDLDQQQTANSGLVGINYLQSVGQTFTAGKSGNLDRVDLDLVRTNNPDPLFVELRGVSAGVPTAPVLASTSVSATSVSTTHGFVPVTFSAPAPVTAGTQYAIVIYTAASGGNFYQVEDVADAYPLGTEIVSLSGPPVTPWSHSDGYDLAFKTYVAPPVAPPVAVPVADTGQRAAALHKCKHKHSKRARAKCRGRARRLPV